MVSIIVTVHNSEQYLKRCLDSVCNQTYKNIEILCVDGGSIDRSPNILKEYADRDNRIRIINDHNTSYGHKINVGIEQSRGEYISVLESDDEYEPDMVEKLMEIFAIYPEMDFVDGEYRQFWDFEDNRFYLRHKLHSKQPYNCIIDNTTKDRQLEIMDRYWTGIYKKEFIIKNDIKLNESPGASYQDMSFRFLLCVLAEKCYHIDKPVYRYRMDNVNSSMKDASKIMTIVYEHQYLQNELEKRNITDRDVWHERYYYKYVDFYGNMTSIIAEEGQKIIYDAVVEELKKDIHNMPDYSVDNYPHADLDEMEDKENYLEKISTKYNKNKRNEKRMIKLFRDISQGAIYIIFGCGIRGQRYKKCLIESDDNMPVFIDNSSSKWNQYVDGKLVMPPAEAVKKYPDAFFIVANASHEKEMAEQLLELGVNQEKIMTEN